MFNFWNDVQLHAALLILSDKKRIAEAEIIRLTEIARAILIELDGEGGDTHENHLRYYQADNRVRWMEHKWSEAEFFFRLADEEMMRRHPDGHLNGYH